MKSLIFYDPSTDMKVEYITNLDGKNNFGSFAVMQINGTDDALLQYGIHYQPIYYTIEEFIKFATDNDIHLLLSDYDHLTGINDQIILFEPIGSAPAKMQITATASDMPYPGSNPYIHQLFCTVSNPLAGENFTYSWKQIGGDVKIPFFENSPVNTTSTFQNPHIGPIPYHPGTYTFQVTVTSDQRRGDHIATVSCKVLNRAQLGISVPNFTQNLNDYTRIPVVITNANGDELYEMYVNSISGPALRLSRNPIRFSGSANLSQLAIDGAQLITKGVTNFGVTIIGSKEKTGIDIAHATSQLTVGDALPVPSMQPIMNTTTQDKSNFGLRGAIINPLPNRNYSYQWTLVSGPNIPTLDDPSGIALTPTPYSYIQKNLNISGGITGDYDFTLTFTDQISGVVLTRETIVHLNILPPTIEIPYYNNSNVVRQSDAFTEIFQLNHKNVGETYTYTYNQISGPNTATVSNGSGNVDPIQDTIIHISNAITGTYVFEIDIVGSLGFTGSLQQTVQTNIAAPRQQLTVSIPDLTANTNTHNNIIPNLPYLSPTQQYRYFLTQISGPGTTTFGTSPSGYLGNRSNNNDNSFSIDLITSVPGNYTYQFAIHDQVNDSLGNASCNFSATVASAAPTSTPAVITPSYANKVRTNRQTTDQLTLSATIQAITTANTSYIWTLVSGPSGYNFAPTGNSFGVLNNSNGTNGTVTTPGILAAGLIVGDTYTFRITLTNTTDNLTPNTADITITI